MPRRIRPAALRIASISLLALALVGCATVPPSARNPRDPWQRVNRGIYKFNDAVDTAVVAPVARTYLRVIPQLVRTGVTNFFNNLTSPDTIVNALLQGQLKPFARDTGRFVVNSTIGIGGLFDPATSMGLTLDARDFGQTFGKWGIPSGPYVVLPFLGPSDVRDAIGRVPDEYADPRHYIRNPYWDYGLLLLYDVKARADLLPLTDMAKKTFDPYAFERNAYLQHRDFMVKGPQAENSAEEELKQLQQEPP
ncbi:MAG TPA: VacJ family lipoprotein [Steroidobacteraceae bacterium]|nr:VacJ family lipoprotein [Steroidobacteraceae bacterium]